MGNLKLETTDLIVVATVAFCMLVQAIALLATFIVLRKALRNMLQELSETRTKVTELIDKVQPVIATTSEFLTRTTPKLESTVSDLAEVAQKLRAESSNVQSAAAEIVERARRQGARMDSMMTNTLNTVDRAAGFVTDTLGKPMRQLSAVLASAKAVVDSLRTSAPEGRPHQGEQSNGEPDYYA